MDMQSLDLKAEVLAAEWIEAGVPEHRIVIKSIGTLHRSQTKDIIEHALDEDDTLLATERDILFTSREGIYDMLPQCLFHYPAPPKNANEHEILDYFKQHKKEEKNARLYFLPFEQAINQQRIANVRHELNLQKGGEDARMHVMFSEFWSLFKLLNGQQATYFIKILPHFHELRGDKQSMEALMTRLLQVPVSLDLQLEAKHVLQGIIDNNNTFGQILGVNFIPGEPFYYDGDTKLNIQIGPVSQQQAASFLQPQQHNFKLLSMLCDYLLPIEWDYEWNFTFDKEETLMTLNDAHEGNAMVMGINTILT
jgi:type VI secretion system protein ImpH